MAIYRATVDAEAGLRQNREEGDLDHKDGPQADFDALAMAREEYAAHTTEARALGDEPALLKQRQGWELKKLGEACKALLGNGEDEHNGLSVEWTQRHIRSEWQRRKGLSQEEQLREAAERDEISERTGKPKKAPRGKPFGKGKDGRRLQERGDQGDGDGDAEQGEGEGDGQGQGVMPPEPEATDNPLDDHIRKIARQEDAKLAKAIDANFGAIAKELAKIKAIKGAAQGREIKITLPNGEIRKIEGVTHALLPKILRKVTLFPNTMLVGPAGCGKTHIGKQVAEALGYYVNDEDPQSEFAAISCSIGMSESALTGRLLPTGDNGQFQYAIAEFVRLYENGGLFLLDEMDACDPNVLITINGAIANGRMPLPTRIAKPLAVRHPRFKLMAAANTYGHGATRMYVGRNQLDATTTDRFIGAVIDMDYDRELEAAMCDDKAWLKAFWAIRDKVTSLQMRRIWSTRALIAGATMLAAGDSIAEVLRELTVGWTPDEKSKVGVA